MDSSQIITLILLSLCVVISNADEQINKSTGNIRKNFIKVQGTFRGGRSGIRRQNGRQILAKRKTADNNDDPTSVPVDDPTSVPVDPVLIKDLYRMFKEVQEDTHSEVDTNVEGTPISKNNKKVQQLQSGSYRFAIPGRRQPTNQRSIGRQKDNEKFVQKVPRFPQSGSRQKSVQENRKNVNLENKGKRIKSNLSLRPKITGRHGQDSKISKQNKKPSNVHIRIKPKINHLSGRVFPAKKTFSKDIKIEDVQPTNTIKKKKKVSLPETPRISNFEGVHTALFGKRLPLNFENLSRTGRPAIKIDLLENPIQPPVQHILPVKRKRPNGIVASKSQTVDSLEEGSVVTQREPVVEEQTVSQKQKKYSKKISKEKMMKLSDTNRQNNERLLKEVNANLEKRIESSRPTGRQRASLGTRKFIDPRKNSVEETLTTGARHSSHQTILALGNKQDNIFKRRKFMRKNIVPAAESEIGEDNFTKIRKKAEKNELPISQSEIEKLPHEGSKNNIIFKRIKPLDQTKLPVQDAEVNEPRQTDTFLKRRNSFEFGKSATGQSKSEESNQDKSSLEKTRLAVGQINSRKFRKGIKKNNKASNKRKFSVLKKASSDSSKAAKPGHSDSNTSHFLDIENSSVNPTIRITLRKHVPSRKTELLVNGRISTKRRGTKGPKLIGIGISQSLDKENDDNPEVNNIINDSNNRKTVSQFRRRKPVLNNVQQSRDNNSENINILDTNTGIKRSRSQIVPELEVVNAQTGPELEVINAQTGPELEVTNAQTGPELEVINAQTGPELEVINAQTGPRQHQVNRKQLLGKKYQGQRVNVSLKDPSQRAQRRENTQNESNVQKGRKTSELFKRRRSQSLQHENKKGHIKSIEHDSIPDKMKVVKQPGSAGIQENLKLVAVPTVRTKIQSDDGLDGRPQPLSLTTQNTPKLKHFNLPNVVPFTAFNWQSNDEKKGSKENGLKQDTTINKILEHSTEAINKTKVNNSFKMKNHPKTRQRNIKKISTTKDIATISQKVLSEKEIRIKESNVPRKSVPRVTVTNEEDLVSRNDPSADAFKTRQSQFAINTTTRFTLQNNKHLTSINRVPAIIHKTKENNLSRNTTPRPTFGIKDNISYQTNIQRSTLNNKDNLISINNPSLTTLKAIQPHVSPTTTPRSTLANRKYSFSRSNTQRNILNNKQHSIARTIPPVTTEKTVQPSFSRTNIQRNILNNKQHSIARNILPATTEKTVQPNLSRTTLVNKEPTFSRTNIIKNIIKTLSPKDNSKGRHQPSATTLKNIQSNLSRHTTQKTTSQVKESRFTRIDIPKAEEPNVLEESTPVIIGTTEIYHLPIIKQNEFPEEIFGAPTEITPYTVDIALKHAEDTWKQDPYREEIEEAPDILFDIDYSKDPDPSSDNTEATSSFISEIENESKLSVTGQPFHHINNEKPIKEKTQTSVQERRQSRRNGKIGHVKYPKTITSEIRNQQINLPGIEGKPLMDQIFILEEFGSSSFNKNRARGKRNAKEDVSNMSKENRFAEDESWILKYN